MQTSGAVDVVLHQPTPHHKYRYIQIMGWTGRFAQEGVRKTTDTVQYKHARRYKDLPRLYVVNKA